MCHTSLVTQTFRSAVYVFFVIMSNMDLKYLTIYCTLCVGFALHLLLLTCLARDPLKCFRNSASYLITNLAIADFILCATGIIQMILGSQIGTVLYEKILISISLVSIFSIFLIAIDRYVLTVRPFAHRVLLTGKRIAVCIASLWIVSICHLVIELKFGPYLKDPLIYNAIFITVALLTAILYLITYLSLRRQERDISQQGQCQNRTLKQEFLKTITIVALIQILTLLPANLCSLFGLQYRYGNGNPEKIMIPILQMYWLNFALNPFLYIWRLKNYRRSFCLIFCRKTR